MGRRLLRALFAAARTCAHNFSIEADFYLKALIMVGAALPHQRIGNHLIPRPLHQLLEAGLIVVGALALALFLEDKPPDNPVGTSMPPSR